jgi:hypothetical protein
MWRSRLSAAQSAKQAEHGSAISINAGHDCSAVHAQSSSPATDLRDKVAPDARAATEPAAEKLAALRNVDETGALRKQCGT